jgi:hypothetical protein
MRTVLRCFAATICGAFAIASTSIGRSPASVERGVQKRYAAVAFDYFVLFNPDSVVSVVDRIAPGKGREFTNLWRTRQFEYSWLRSITGRYVDFFAITEDALLYTANAMQNRFNQPLEELGLHPDRTVTDLNGLLDFVLKQER